MSNVETEFQELASTWARETMHLSSVADMVRHPYYQRIIEMGPAVVPYILRDLEREPHHWFHALYMILNDGPEIWIDQAGDMGALSKIWLGWCLHQGISPAPLPITP